MIEKEVVKNPVIFIRGHVPSSKNNRVFVVKLKRSFPSKACAKYIRESKNDYKDKGNEFLLKSIEIKPPLKVGFHFVRKSRHKFDFHNAVQLVADLMVKNGWLIDDNMDEFIPIPMKDKNGKYYSYDKINPGVYIKILNR